MCDYMVDVIRTEDTPENRNLLSVSFKNLVGPRRKSLRTIDAVLVEEQRACNVQRVRHCTAIRDEARVAILRVPALADA